MPKFPSNMAKARAAASRQAKKAEARAQKRAAQDAHDQQILQDFADEIATKTGTPREQVTMIVCRRGARR
ncbi:MAG: hypothetical protein KGL35_08075 [Bradyrhizobium sp.]|nr:hypothetical protein [Bradyrhizobium sp.]